MTHSQNFPLPQHGGDLALLAHAPKPWLDLSTGINPYAYPLPPCDAEWLRRLPTPQEVNAAQTAAGEGAVLGPGMQPLMFGLASLRYRLHGRSRIIIPGPTYAEHARVWRAAGHEVADIPLENASQDTVTVICDPNNPDGKTYEALAHPGWLIVDASFADLASPAPRRENLAVLRSYGKFFGLAGMRMSACLAPPEWAEYLRAVTGPWPLSTHACRALPAMLHDTGWIRSMAAQLAKESAAWREILAQHFALIGHTHLFTLVEAPDAARWHQRLAAQGILTRVFAEHPRWLRFGLPDAAALPRVAEALRG